MNKLQILALACVLLSTLWAEEEAKTTLINLAESCYNHESAGLNRASCMIESSDIANALDAGSKRLVNSMDFEAIFTADHKVEVKAKNIPNRLGPEGVMGAKMFTVKVEVWLNKMLKYLDDLPKTIHPEQGLKNYEIQWEEGREGRVIKLFKNAESKKDQHPRHEDRMQGPMAKKMQELMKERNMRDQRREEMMTNLKKDSIIPEVELDGVNMEIHLSSSGQLEEFISPSGSDLQKIRIKTKKIGKQWLIEDLDVALFDDQNRLKERNLIRYNYTQRSGVYLPLNITMKALDAKGKLLDRRDDPNPLTINFSKHLVEVRK
jgi:hypothetical protein